MNLFRKSVAVPALVGAMLLAGCATTQQQTIGASQGDADHTIVLAVVPGQDIGLIYAPQVQEIFEEHRITLDVTEISGQEAVSSVTDGDYDLAYSAYVPPILAVDEGVDLQVISGLSNLGPAGNNGATMVPADAGIATWSDLAGKRVGVASERSYSTLGLEAAIIKDGGEGAMELVVTPMGKIGAALDEGKVDAGDLIDPYASAARVNYPKLISIGDAKEFALGENTPLSAFFTVREKAEENAVAFEAFKLALDEAVAFGNENPDEVKLGAAGQAGLSKEVARTLPDSVYGSSATAEELQPIIDLMIEVGWIDGTIDVSEFAAG